jgi:N-methylhydantoinase A
MLVGVDIGGTFTDLILSRDGKLQVHKLLSTPEDPSRAMLQGLRELRADLSCYTRISHGSTVATNAILERTGARTALITTGGFRDMLAIGRQNRPDLYALQPSLPTPLIPRKWCFAVPERLDHQGRVLQPLDLAALDRVIDSLEAESIQSVAVCLLYSYENDLHEQTIKEKILERGFLEEWQIALSSEVLPEFREYERASTVALEAYVRPVMNGYLRNLENGLPESSTLRIMTSDGGVMSARRARRQAIQTALSGPAAGVIGGAFLAQQAGYDQIITLDMGGTSTDVSLCPGEPVLRVGSDIDGLPLRTRLLDIETIGAGGGSIARLDAGGALRVGPESAGADPGPIVYGQGGKELTVTDANTLLGRMDPDHFLGGEIKLKLAPARTSLQSLAKDMSLTPQETALGILRVANVNIDRALRKVSVARGYDPRDFTLVAFGGAGPLHACPVAEALEIPRVLIPRHPGVLCAYGLLMADVLQEQSRSVIGPVTRTAFKELNTHLEDMKARSVSTLLAEGIAREKIRFHALVHARYQGQSYELPVPLQEDLVSAFHALHAETYGHSLPERPVELVTLRLQAVGQVDKPVLSADPVVKNDAQEALIGEKPGVEKGNQPASFTLYDRPLLSPGAEFRGPALVFQMDSTTYLPSRWTARVDGFHNLILERA